MVTAGSYAQMMSLAREKAKEHISEESGAPALDGAHATISQAAEGTGPN